MILQGRLEQKRVSSIASVGLNDGKDNSNKPDLYLKGAKISVKQDSKVVKYSYQINSSNS